MRPSLSDLRDMAPIYLASPYSNFHLGLDEACRQAAVAAAILIEDGFCVFSPIAHSHTVAREGGLDALDADLWKEIDAPLVKAAAGMIVLMLPGWRKSHGVQHEIAEFTAAGKPIVYLNTEEVGL